jgi:hypothetical protein
MLNQGRPYRKEVKPMKRTLIFGVAFGFVVILLAIPYSSPLISLQTLPQWEDAWNAGQIQPVTEWNAGFESHYPGMEPQFRIPNLEVMPSIPQEPDTPGLVMSWGSPADDGQEIIAAWEYVYDDDPDLTNYLIHLCVFPPCNVINTISFGLKDINGNIKSWDWAVWPWGIVPCDTQVCFTINPVQGAGQWGATSYYMDAAFDLTKVQWLIFDENGVWVDSLQADPAGFGQNAWNYWKEIWIEGPVRTEESTWGRIKAKFLGGNE